MIDWINRHSRSPEVRVWINTGPLRNGHNTHDVIADHGPHEGRAMHRFNCKVAAESYRQWVIAWMYARILHDRHAHENTLHTSRARSATKVLPRR